MKLLVIAALVATCTADLLALRQRAPSSASSAGGGDFLSGPRNTYVPPSNQYIPPTNQYLPPQQPSPMTQYLPPQQPKPMYLPPKPQYIPPASTARPSTQYLPPQNSYLPPQKPGNSYLPPGSGHSGPTTPPVPILKQTNELNEDQSYKYEYLSGDQTHVEAMGHIENPGTDHEEQVMHGSYSYVGDDGKTYSVTYIADANGFRAFGDHLPTPPPIPEAIQKALDQNAAEEAAHAGQGYPSGGPSQGYPSGGPSQGYPSGGPMQQYLPPQKPERPSFNPQSGYHY